MRLWAVGVTVHRGSESAAPHTSLDFHRPDTTSVHSRILTNIMVGVALQEFRSGILVGPLGC